MQSALDLARRGRGRVEPNPMVGCVIVRDGGIIGRGHHNQFGGPHAEVTSLESLESHADAKGATAYVTLEPCCHFGKTPPCSDALIGSGIARVVVAMEDPFEQVSGGGIAKLREAGIEVVVGVLGEAARRLNAPFLKRVRTGRPWVIAKWAMTMDGRIATVSGESQWITGETSRTAVHRLRGRVDAIGVGMGTVIADDPMLNARPAGPRVATRIVFCRHRLPSLQSKLVRSAGEYPLTLFVGPETASEQLAALETAGVEVIRTDADSSTAIDETLEHLAKNGATNLLLEGGAEIFGSFFSARQIDECHVFVGAKVFGSSAAPGPIGGAGVGQISQAWSFELQKVDRFDDDIRLIYRSS